jgi:hypothetical protein
MSLTICRYCDLPPTTIWTISLRPSRVGELLFHLSSEAVISSIAWVQGLDGSILLPTHPPNMRVVVPSSAMWVLCGIGESVGFSFLLVSTLCLYSGVPIGMTTVFDILNFAPDATHHLSSTACSSESLFPFHARRRCPGTVSAVSTRGKSYTIKSLPDCVVHTREGQGHEVWIPSTATTAIFQLHTTCHTCAPEENTINYRVHLSRNVHVQSRDPALSLPLRSTRTQPSNLPSAASARSLQLSCATRGSISTSDKWIYSGRD